MYWVWFWADWADSWKYGIGSQESGLCEEQTWMWESSVYRVGETGSGWNDLGREWGEWGRGVGLGMKSLNLLTSQNYCHLECVCLVYFANTVWKLFPNYLSLNITSESNLDAPSSVCVSLLYFVNTFWKLTLPFSPLGISHPTLPLNIIPWTPEKHKIYFT